VPEQGQSHVAQASKMNKAKDFVMNHMKDVKVHSNLTTPPNK
jgi:hypothetical protein